jgi:tetratricopeptide (TPR) repeat protein|tara:strand:- start:1871 stop:3511 length:1641 start_codon:yes stop_codon:yes gene_type:complete
MKFTVDQALQKGVAAHKAGKLKEAEKIYQAILQIHPMHTAVHSNLGVMLYKLGRLDEAELSYKKLIAQKPDNAEAHSNLGVIQQELNKFNEAEASCKKAIELNPDYVVAHNNLSNTLKKLDRLDEAESSYRITIALKPDYVEAHYNLSVMLQELDRLSEAEESCKKAIELKPNYSEAHNNLGITLQKIGRIEEAKESYKKAIEFKSDYVEAHLNLSQLKSFNNKDQQFIQIQNLYLNQALTDDQRCHLSFALGKASEDLNQFDKSFKYYTEGNTLRKKSMTYNINQDIELFDQLKKSYPVIKKNSLETFNFQNEPKLIFILGMPRSGTTLVEQIISSHSEVMGAGELSYIEQFGDKTARGISKINNNVLINFRESYLKKIQALSKGSSMVTDKMTINFRYIGLIYSAFPKAKIIHIKRNSAATCWGNYKQLFSNKKSFHYCYDLDSIITYYALYKDLMQFWEKNCGNRIYTLSYEMLTINQEVETRKLIKHLDLEWEETCLAPQNNKRSVGTASSRQIRQKVYQGSSEKWKKFEPFLNGVFNHLKD